MSTPGSGSVGAGSGGPSRILAAETRSQPGIERVYAASPNRLPASPRAVQQDSGRPTPASVAKVAVAGQVLPSYEVHSAIHMESTHGSGQVYRVHTSAAAPQSSSGLNASRVLPSSFSEPGSPRFPSEQQHQQQHRQQQAFQSPVRLSSPTHAEQRAQTLSQANGYTANAARAHNSSPPAAQSTVRRVAATDEQLQVGKSRSSVGNEPSRPISSSASAIVATTRVLQPQRLTSADDVHSVLSEPITRNYVNRASGAAGGSPPSHPTNPREIPTERTPARALSPRMQPLRQPGPPNQDDIVPENDQDLSFSRGTTPAAHRNYRAVSTRWPEASPSETMRHSSRASLPDTSSTSQGKIVSDPRQLSPPLSRSKDGTASQARTTGATSMSTLRPSMAQQEQQKLNPASRHHRAVAAGGSDGGTERKRSQAQNPPQHPPETVRTTIPASTTIQEDEDEDEDIEEGRVQARKAAAAAAAAKRGQDPEEVEQKLQAELSERRLLKAALKLQQREPAWLRDLRESDSYGVRRRRQPLAQQQNSEDTDEGEDADETERRETWQEFFVNQRAILRRSWRRMGIITKFLYLLYTTILATAIATLVLGIDVNRQLLGPGDGCVTTTLVYSAFVILFSLWTIWAFYSRSPKTLYAIFYFSIVLAAYGYLVAFLETTCTRPPIGKADYFSFERTCTDDEIKGAKSPSKSLPIHADCCRHFPHAPYPVCACFAVGISENDPIVRDFVSWRVQSCKNAERLVYDLSVIGVFSVLSATAFVVYLLWYIFLRKPTYKEWANQFNEKLLRRRARNALDFVKRLQEEAQREFEANPPTQSEEDEADLGDLLLDDDDEALEDDLEFLSTSEGSSESLARQVRRKRLQRRKKLAEYRFLLGGEGEDPKAVKRRRMELAARLALSDAPLILDDTPGRYDYVPTRVGLRRLEPGTSIEVQPILVKMHVDSEDPITDPAVEVTTPDLALPPVTSMNEVVSHIRAKGQLKLGTRIMGLIGLSSKEINRRRREESLSEAELARRRANNPLQPDLDNELCDDTALETIGDSEDESSEDDEVLEVLRRMDQLAVSSANGSVGSAADDEKSPLTQNSVTLPKSTSTQSHVVGKGNSIARGRLTNIRQQDPENPAGYEPASSSAFASARMNLSDVRQGVAPLNVPGARGVSQQGGPAQRPRQTRYDDQSQVSGDIEMVQRIPRSGVPEVPSPAQSLPGRAMSPRTAAQAGRSGYQDTSGSVRSVSHAFKHPIARSHADEGRSSGPRGQPSGSATNPVSPQFDNTRPRQVSSSQVHTQNRPEFSTQPEPILQLKPQIQQSRQIQQVRSPPQQQQRQEASAGIRQPQLIPASRTQNVATAIPTNLQARLVRPQTASPTHHTMPTSGTVTPSDGGTPVTYRLAFPPHVVNRNATEARHNHRGVAIGVGLDASRGYLTATDVSAQQAVYLPAPSHSQSVRLVDDLDHDDHFVFRPDPAHPLSPSSHFQLPNQGLSGYASQHPAAQEVYYRPPSVPASPTKAHTQNAENQGGHQQSNDGVLYDVDHVYVGAYDDDDEYSISYSIQQ